MKSSSNFSKRITPKFLLIAGRGFGAIEAAGSRKANGRLIR
jgi:hypothetical protein